MGDSVRVVVLGNSFAARVQLPALRHAGTLGGVRAEVVGIAGSDAEKAAATAHAWSIPHSSGRWQELLALEPELVIVATPVHLHMPMVLATLEQTGAAVLCEKPFAVDSGEARVMLEHADGRLCLLDHQLRWSPWRRELTRRVRAGFLGEVWHGRASMLLGPPARLAAPPAADAAPYGWWYDAERGGGVLGATGSHLIDGLCVDLGGVQALRAHLSTYVRQRADAAGALHDVTADEHARLWLSFEGGAEVSLEASMVTPAACFSSVEYVGSAGSLRLEDETRLVATRHGEQPEEVAVDAARVPTPEAMGTPDLGPFARILPLYLADVLGAVAAGATELEGAADFASGLATLRVLEAARHSSRDATWVECGER